LMLSLSNLIPFHVLLLGEKNKVCKKKIFYRNKMAFH